jgi:hypothetical protein
VKPILRRLEKLEAKRPESQPVILVSWDSPGRAEGEYRTAQIRGTKLSRWASESEAAFVDRAKAEAMKHRTGNNASVVWMERGNA